MYIDGQVAKVESMTSDGSVKLSIVVPRELVSGKDLLSLQHQNVRVTDEQETLLESTVTSSRDESLSILADNADKLVAANMELLSLIKAELQGEAEHENVLGSAVLFPECDTLECDYNSATVNEYGQCKHPEGTIKCSDKTIKENRITVIESVTVDMNKPNGACDTAECAYNEHGKCYNQEIGNQCVERSLPESTTVDINKCYNTECDFHEGDTTCTDDPSYSCPLHKPEVE